MDKELLKSMLEQKLVLVQKHPDTDLFIYNYSPLVQYQKLWNEITLMTRGLILDKEMNIVARPFKKFFNLEEHSPEEIPQEAFDVFNKEDGSLGILYWINDKPAIATRGSFTSDQALHATQLLRDRYGHTFDSLKQENTYLFEIIYPENRIVVNYGDLDDLILLAVLDSQTGQDLSIPDIGFPIVKKFDGINDLNELREIEKENQEGFVIRFKSGFRIKVKFSEYVRLHRIITQTSSTVVWENLATGKSFEELLEKVPDEFYEWVKQTKTELTQQFDAILLEAKSAFKTFETRKETAAYFLTQKYPHVMFKLLDEKDPSELIWKMIKPKHSKPFKLEI